MRTITETRECDGCGAGPHQGGNVPYLGWTYIQTTRIGLIGSPLLKADLCPTCTERVFNSIPLTTDIQQELS